MPQPDRSLRATESRAIRHLPAAGLELRKDSSGAVVGFEGYASVTGEPYEVWDMFGPFSETIAPGAFKRTLKGKPDVQLLINHEGMALARTRSGTLRLAEDDTGLHVDADLDPRSATVREVTIALERGDMDQMSFAFRVAEGGDEWNDSYDERTINEVILHRGDVSIVNQGASPTTTAALRALATGLDVTPEQFARAFTERDPDVLRRTRDYFDSLITEQVKLVDTQWVVDAIREHDRSVTFQTGGTLWSPNTSVTVGPLETIEPTERKSSPVSKDILAAQLWLAVEAVPPA